MTRTTLTVLLLLAAGAASLGVATAFEVAPWWALPAVPITWFGLVAAGRAFHSFWVRRTIGRELRRGRPGRASRALEIAARAHAAGNGEAGFTRETRPAPALERAVLLPAAAGDEEAVLAELRASSAESRSALVRGLRDLQDEAVEALGAPLHPLFPDAHRLLGLLGYRVPRAFGRLRAERSWARRRPLVDPERPEEAVAVRLLAGGMSRAALAALSRARRTPRMRSLRRLARLTAVLRRGEAGSVALRTDEFAAWAPELLLLAGRRLRDLVPGSPFLRTARGGAVELERTIAHTDRIAAELAALAAETPELFGSVRLVVARIVRRTPTQVDAELRRGTLTAQPDRALRMHLRGLALLDEGRPLEAVAEFEGALRRAPGFAPAAYSLATCRRLLGHPRRGVRELRAYASRHPADVDARLLLARFLSEEGREREARRVYEAALERFPDSLALRVAYAQDLLEWGDEEGACDHLDVAHEEHPDDPRLAFLAGRARVTGGRSEDAVQPLERASSGLAGPEQAEARYWLLAALREQGRHDRAVELAVGLVGSLGSGQEGMLEDLADYLEERHEFLHARTASERARRLRGEPW